MEQLEEDQIDKLMDDALDLAEHNSDILDSEEEESTSDDSSEEEK